MGTDLAVPNFSAGDIELMAKKVAGSRLFPGIESENAAFTLMMLCQSEDLHPMQALRRFHIISGRPAMRADAMQAEFQRQGGVIRWRTSNAVECVATFLHPVHAPEPGVELSYSMDEAQQCGLAENRMYRKYPAQMLRARVISQGVRMVLPGVVVGIYTEAEFPDDEPDRRRPEPIDVEEVRPRKPAGELSGRDAVNATFAPPVAPSSTAPIEKPAGKAKPAENRPWDKFVRDACKHVNDSHLEDCDSAGIACKDVVVELQVNRHVLKWAVANGVPDPEPADADGKRKRIGEGKVALVLKDLYSHPEWQGPMRGEVKRYAKGKLDEATRELYRDASPPAEDTSQESPDPGDGEVLEAELVEAGPPAGRGEAYDGDL